MADEMKISLGFDEPRGGEGSAGVSVGIAKGLKVAGVVGLLSKLSIVTDTIGIALQLIQVGIVTLVGFIGGLLGLFISKVIPFVEDPFRAFLGLGLFIVNGIITGLEFVLNGILGFFGADAVELPRFQKTLVTEALDEGVNFAKALSDSFITNTEFQEVLKERAIEAQIASTSAIGSVDDLAKAIQTGGNISTDNMSLAFEAVDAFTKALKDRANEALSSLGVRRVSGSLTSAQAGIDYALRQNTNLNEKQSKSGLYLLNKLGG